MRIDLRIKTQCISELLSIPKSWNMVVKKRIKDEFTRRKTPELDKDLALMRGVELINILCWVTHPLTHIGELKVGQ